MRRWFPPAVLTLTVCVLALTTITTARATDTRPVSGPSARVAAARADLGSSAVVTSPAGLVGDPTTITATIPSRTYDARAKGRTITGTVSGTPRRLVQIQARGSNGTWVTLAQIRSTSTGTFSITTPTWWVAKQKLRAYAPATDADQEAASTDTGSITVNRTYKPRGGTAFEYLLGRKARWNPCAPIAYRVNPTRLPDNGRAMIRSGLREISEATGLRFTYAGASTFVPYKAGLDSLDFPDNADLVIAWAPARLVPGLAGGTVGLGGAQSTVIGSSSELHSGGVVFDTSARMGGTAAERRKNWRILVMHELGHAVGLHHVLDRRQIMAPGAYPRKAEFGAGDLRGLANVGATGGCIPDSIRLPGNEPRLRSALRPTQPVA